MVTSSQFLTLETFINQYCHSPRYELVDGELIDRSPTGLHKTVSGKLATQIGIALVAEKPTWFIPRTCLIRPFANTPTASRPDIIVLDETLLVHEPLWKKEPVITLGKSIKLVVEVVSTHWETDYARKVEEYALLGIREYWIVDYQGLGGVAFIGKPKQPTFTVCELIDEDYQQKQYRLGEPVLSPSLPSLKLCLNDILPR